MADSIRIVLFDRDKDTGARSVCDIHELDAPELAAPGSSFTKVSKDRQRRELLLLLSRQVDELLTGRIDEISVCLITQNNAAA